MEENSMAMLRTLGLLVCALMLTAAPAAHAQWAVVDVGAIAQLVEQVATLRAQLETARNQLTQAQQQYQSMTGGRGMEQLLAGTVRNYLPSDWQALEAALNGVRGSYGELSTQLNATIVANAVLTPDHLARLSTHEREQLHAARKSAALLQVTSRSALAASSARFASLQRLINAISTASDQKAVLDLQARMLAEQAMLQNEQTKLMVLYHAAQAEELARRQRASELAITNIGSLRRSAPIGLNE
jgi:type IV secretion system protein VirB5